MSRLNKLNSNENYLMGTSEKCLLIAGGDPKTAFQI